MKLRQVMEGPRAQWRGLSRSARLFMAATVLHGTFFAIWQLFLNLYILAAGFEREFLGLLISAPAAAALLLGLPLGILIDRIGRKRAMLVGLTVGGGAVLAMLTTHDRNLLLAMSFVEGAGHSLVFISQAPFLAKLSGKENRSFLFSLNFALMTLSGLVGSTLGGLLPGWFEALFGITAGSAMAYRAAMLTGLGIDALTFLPLLLLRVPGDGERTEGHVQPGLRTILRKPILLQLSLPNLLIGIGAALLVPYFNLFFVEKFNLGDSALGTLFGLGALVTGLGALASPRLAERLGTRIRAVVLTQASSLLFLLMMGFSPVFGFAAIGFLARGALMNMAVPLYEAFSMDQVPENEQGTVNGGLNLGWELGWVVGPYLSTLVQKAYGFTPLFLMTSVFYGLAIILIWIFFRHNETAAVLDAAGQAS